MEILRLAIPGSLCAVLMALFPGGALAQDPAKVAPDVYKVISDNEHVRVLDVQLKPGSKSPMHSHPGHVVATFSPCKVRFTSPQGKTEDFELKAGESGWRDAESHSVENIGTTDCHALNVEVKKAARKAK